MRLKPKSVRPGPDIRVIALGTALLSLPASYVLADVTLPPVSVGAGIRTSFTHSETDGVSQNIDDFNVDSARLYLSGKVTENISLMFNTEYDGGDEKLVVMDAAAQFAFSDTFNIWAGRFLPPSDRANLYGPYYASEWGVYSDGSQDGYPAESIGRDDGVMYWGQFGIAKVSFGAFDIKGLTKGNSKVLYAGRVQLDFWDPEGGYYLNGTYYGEKDLLAIGVAGQKVSSDSAYSADFLLEKKLGNAGVVTVEAEYAKYDGLGGYGSPRAVGYKSSDGEYLLAAYMFPQEVGIGKFQLLAKYARATYDFDLVENVDQDTFEFNLNYLIKTFNARLSLFYVDTSYSPSNISVAPDSKRYGLGLQVQM